jgi:anti-sigma B factor antagonist
MKNYEIEVKNSNTSELRLSSLLDPTENQKILAEIVGLMEGGATQWVINLQQMSFLNSTGLNFLISLLTRSRTIGGEVVVVGISEKIQQVLVLTRLQTMFVVCADVEAALNFLLNRNENAIF